LAPVFSPARAELIAVTEITRAASAGVELTRKEIAKAGIEMGRVWQMNNDELTCPVCGGLNGKSEADWNRQYPDGPPGASQLPLCGDPGGAGSQAARDV
jgi:hypothetical protein